MLIATVLVTLSASPALAPVADDFPQTGYDLLTRSELRAARAQLEAKRPGLLVPVGLSSVGALGAFVAAIAFWVEFSTPYGIAIYGAVLCVAAFITGLGMFVGGTTLYVRRKPERDAIGHELELIDDALDQGRCRSVENQEPCQNDPHPFFDHVRAPGPLPSLVLASF